MSSFKSKNNKKSKKGESSLVSMFTKSVDQIGSFATKRYTGKGAAMNIAHDMQMLKSVLNVENKHADQISTAVSISNTVSYAQVLDNTIIQGTAEGQRTGNSIKLDRLDIIFKFAYSTGTSSITQDQLFEYHIVRWLKPPSAGTPVLAIADYFIADPDSNYTPLSLPNAELQENFKLLASGSVFVQNPYSISAVNNIASRHERITVPLNFHQEYLGAASSTLVDGVIGLFVVCKSPVNTGGTSNMEYSARLWYVDN